jgi:flavorubredoxin
VDAYQIADETFVIPSVHPAAGGLLPVNSMIIRGTEPVLVETGAPYYREQWLAQAWGIVDPADVRWIFLSHEDRDHSGNLMEVLEACPNARLVTTAIGTSKLTYEWKLPMDRVVWLNHGESFVAGDRTLVAQRPPLFDTPGTRGLWDATTKTYFSVDAFGTLLHEEVPFVADAPTDVYGEGFDWFNRVNHTWYLFADPTKVDVVVEEIRALGPERIVSAHAPVATEGIDALCDRLEAVYRMPPLPPPGQAELEATLAKLAAGKDDAEG